MFFVKVYTIHLLNVIIRSKKAGKRTFLRKRAISADPVFDPTLALIRFSEDLHLSCAMITAASCGQLTWVLSPATGMDLQPQA